jgi:hypothetical protein
MALPEIPLSLLELGPRLLARIVEETQLDLLGDTADEREARASVVQMGAERRYGCRLRHEGVRVVRLGWTTITRWG